MSGEKKILSRRDIIKAAGAAGLGSALVPFSSSTGAHADTSTKAPEQKFVPTRPFGKTGVDFSIFSLGGVLKDTDQLIFRQAFKSGVTYWDTADSSGWGNNEKAIGSYFAKFPGDREKVFLVTKAAGSNAKELSDKLNTSLQRMNTSYIDMYLLHYVSDVGKELTPEVEDPGRLLGQFLGLDRLRDR
jgi:hypothetical protein